MRLLVALGVLLGLVAAGLVVGFWAVERWSPQEPAVAAPAPTSTLPTPDVEPSLAVTWAADRFAVVGRLSIADAAVVTSALGRIEQREGLTSAVELDADRSVERLADGVLDAATVTVPLLVRTVPSGSAVLGADGWDVVAQLPDDATAGALAARLEGLGGLATVATEVSDGAAASFTLEWSPGEPVEQVGDAPIRLATVLAEFGLRPALDDELRFHPDLVEPLGAIAALAGDGGVVAGSVVVEGTSLDADLQVEDRSTLDAVAAALAEIDPVLGGSVRLTDTVALAEALADGATAGELEFVEGSTRLTSAGDRAVEALASLLRRLPDARLEIVGHTDDRGNAAANERFSEAQAQAIRDALVERGIDPGRLVARGAGESEPIADNATAAGRDDNRRVELRVLEPVTG